MDYISNIRIQLPKILPIISLLFFLGSLWHEGLYYNFFEINIFSYITLSEALNLFIQRLPLMVVLAIIVLIIFYFFQLLFTKPLARLYHLKKYNLIVRRSKIQKTLIITMLTATIPMLLFMVILPTWWRGSYETEGYLIIRGIVFLFVLYFQFHIIISFDLEKYESNYNNLKNIPLIFTLFFFSIIYYYYRYEILKIKKNDLDWRRIEYKIKLKDNETINTSDSIYFLGKTKDFIFLLYPHGNDNKVKTRILKVDDLLELEISRRVAWYSVFP